MELPVFTPACPAGVLERELTVSPEQTDEAGRMRCEALAASMQQITEKHLHSFGWDRETLRDRNKIWVISWSSIEILRLPHSGEALRLRVWPGEKKSGMHTRRYVFYTVSGGPLVSAASIFLLMDAGSRTLATGGDDLDIPAVSLPGEPAAPKLRISFPAEAGTKQRRVVRPEEIDANGHMNNTRYLAWTEELPSLTFRASHEPRVVWIQYVKELMQGQIVTMEVTAEGDSLFVRGRAGGADAFLVNILYRVTGKR